MEKEKEKKWEDYKVGDWHNVFPEAQEIIDIKINELTAEYTELSKKMRESKKVCNNYVSKDKDDITIWFCKYLVDLDIQPRLQEIEKEISCLRRNSKRKEPTNGKITDEMIDIAKKYPIENLISTKIKWSNNTGTAICPLHQEKTGSMKIYKNTNSFCCFGCHVSGNDPIEFYMKLNNCDFIEAVQSLQNY